MVEFDKTNRGFTIGEFKDYYDAKCTIQDSSISWPDCIWLGIADPDPKIMATNAIRLGLPNHGETTGWVPYEIPEEVMVSTRMHLSRDQVRDLIPVLQHFVDTGFLPKDGEMEELEARNRLLSRTRDAMREKLDENAHKPGWENDTFPALFARLKEETVELDEVLPMVGNAIFAADIDPEKAVADLRAVRGEAADVGNFSGMIIDLIDTTIDEICQKHKIGPHAPEEDDD